jgi:type II secretory pathway component PulF
MFGVVVAAVLILLFAEFGRLLLLFLVTVAPVLLLLWLFVALTRRRAVQRETVLAVLRATAKRHLPLGPGLAAASNLCTGRTRRKALGLAYLLENGVEFSRAVKQVRGVVPERTALLAAVGTRHGALAPALEQAALASEAEEETRSSLLPTLGYVAVYLLCLQSIGGFVSAFVAPKLQAIFADFGARLPWVTTWLLGFVQRFWWLWPLLVLAEVVLLVGVGLASFRITRAPLPGATHVLWRRETATILRALGVGVTAGRPVLETLGVLAEEYPVRWVRGRLNKVRIAEENGRDWIESLVSQGLLPETDAAVLEASRRAGNLGWALQTLAGSHERRLAYRLAGLRQLLFPLAVLAMGVIVLVVAVAYMMPLVGLIEQLQVI